MLPSLSGLPLHATDADDTDVGKRSFPFNYDDDSDDEREKVPRASEGASHDAFRELDDIFPGMSLKSNRVRAPRTSEGSAYDTFNGGSRAFVRIVHGYMLM
jgi:hypothetical protein